MVFLPIYGQSMSTLFRAYCPTFKSVANYINMQDNAIIMNKTKYSKRSLNNLMKEIKEAKKDPEFRKELRKFIKATTS